MTHNDLSEEYPYVVLRAFKHHVTDIGQLTKEEKSHLNKFVDAGLLYKGLDYNYPKPKPCWFSRERNLVLPNIIFE